MRYGLALLVGLLVLATPAHADFVLTFDKTNYDVTVGGTVNVNVYLTETGTDILATEGLIGAGLLLNFNAPPSATDPAQVVAIEPNPGVNPAAPDFDFLSTSIVPAGPGLAGVAELDWGLSINTFFPPMGGSSILIGTFTFAAGSVDGDVTNLSTGLSGLKFVAGDGTDIDDTYGIGSTTATITTTTTTSVPEPASLALLVLGLTPVLAWSRSHSARKRLTNAVLPLDVA